MAEADFGRCWKVGLTCSHSVQGVTFCIAKMLPHLSPQTIRQPGAQVWKKGWQFAASAVASRKSPASPRQTCQTPRLSPFHKSSQDMQCLALAGLNAWQAAVWFQQRWLSWPVANSTVTLPRESQCTNPVPPSHAQKASFCLPLPGGPMHRPLHAVQCPEDMKGFASEKQLRCQISPVGFRTIRLA